MTWVLGIMVLLAWHDVLAALGHSVGAWYFAYAIVWFFAGAGALVMSVVRLVAGKMKAGAFQGVAPRGPDASATHKGE